MEVFKLHPLDVHVVIDVIKEFVHDPATLRSCRSVNSVWLNCVNKKALQESTFVGLERIAVAVPEGLGFSKYTKEEELVTVSNIQRLKVKDKVKLLQDENVVNYFEKSGNQLRFLSFVASKNEEMSLVHLQFIDNVLFKWCFQLEELELVGLIENSLTGTNQDQDENDIALRKFVLNYAETCLTSENMSTSVIEKILERAKKLNSFVLMGHQNDPRFVPVSNKILKLVCEKAKNLTTLELSNVPIGAEEIILIKTAGWALNKVIIDGFLDWDVKVSLLNLFLEAHSKSLKYFHFRVNGDFSDDASELKIHTLLNLEVLKIAVQSIKIGSSGLLGKLEKLHHLTLWGQSVWDNSARLNFETMFGNKVSSSIKTLCLDDAYVSEVSSLPKWCPVVSELNIDVSENTINDFLLNINEMVSNRNSIEDLKVTVYFKDFEVNNDELTKRLVIGLFRLKFRTLKIAALHDMYNFPCMRFAWIENAMIGNDNTFFSIVLEGFYIHDDEIEDIANLLTERANFTTWVDCKVIVLSTGRVIPLKEKTFFQDNVKSLSKEIVNCVCENAKAIAQLNFDMVDQLVF